MIINDDNFEEGGIHGVVKIMLVRLAIKKGLEVNTRTRTIFLNVFIPCSYVWRKTKNFVEVMLFYFYECGVVDRGETKMGIN